MASGVLLALSFPRYGHSAVAWIALAPLMVALGAGGLGRAFALGLTTGAFYFAGTLYWISGVMAVYGGDIAFPAAVLINAALIAYLALYPALFAVVVRRSVMSFGPVALVASPLVRVATELGRTYLFTGFPWVLLGYSQTTVLPVAQLASLFGVYGLSALVAAVSAGAAIAALTGRAGRSGGSGRAARSQTAWSYGPLVGAIALVLIVAVWGSRRVAASELTKTGEPIKIGLVQANIDQSLKMNLPAVSQDVFATHLRLTRQAIMEGAQAVLWPESSIPFQVEEDPIRAEQVRTIARQAKVPILVGSDQVDRTSKPPKLYNAAFLIQPDGTTGGVYRKIHLVPFGEYVPAQRIFFFAGHLVDAVSDFSAGTEASLLPIAGHLASTSICYEVVYPDLVRAFVLHGSELLTTITNDAWFGSSSAPYQHFEQASMRAIEEGRYLVRSANTGISGIVDPYGRVLERTDLQRETVLVGTARFLKDTTFYTQHGDVFAYASAVATLLLLLQSRTWRL
ncbi:MAG TPA: apolipoprotein N-acyltransferase [Vicinamibacterales bacterium]|nr:apolipoprotein N-acyltransferase [Vicinamibacterales bacterium]